MNAAVLNLKKKENASLKPLSEKEIQKKLYGSYYEPAPEATEQKVAVAPPPAKSKPAVIPPSFKTPKKEVSITVSKPSIHIPWNAIGGALAVFVKTIWNVFKILLARIPAPWGAGVLIVFFLFFGIHSLNVYRTNAMRQARPRSVPAPAPLPALPMTLPASEEAQDAEVETPLKPAEPILEEEAISSAPAVKKSFVIQIATYARKDDAQKKAEEIKSQNFPAFVQSLSRANQKSFYAVFVGRFETFKEAQAKLREFRKHSAGREFADSFVRTL